MSAKRYMSAGFVLHAPPGRRIATLLAVAVLEQGTKPEFDGLSRHGCSRARRSLGGDLAAPSA